MEKEEVSMQNTEHSNDYAIMELKFWISQQKIIPELSDNFIKTFLHCCYYDLSSCKDALTSFFTIRVKSPQIFQNRRMEALQSIKNLAYIVKLPELTKEGYEVVVAGLYHDDATDFSYTDFYKFFIMAIESWAFMREDNAEGLIVLGDTSNFTFSHLKKLEFGVVKTGFQYFQDALPVRLKKIILINVSSPVNILLNMVQPIIAKRLVHLIERHTKDSTDYFNTVPQKMLPLEYGGDCRSLKDMNSETIDLLHNNEEWFQKEDEILNTLIAKHPQRRSSIFNIFS